MSRVRFSLVTSSYRGDLERCRLLCDSIDRFVTGFERHYILVEAQDVDLFRTLAGPRRTVVCERDLLPWWLRPMNDPFRRRRLWLSPVGPPLGGWHVQQLRRFAMGSRMDEDAMISLDSDVAFVKPFEAAELADGSRVAFYRVPGGLDRVLSHLRADHEAWALRAGRLLGLPTALVPDTTYIGTLIAWRRDTVRALLARIEQSTGRSAMAALCGSRALSECTVYGRFVDEVENRPEHHRADAEQRCAVYWDGPPLDEEGLRGFIEALAPRQVAIGLQSFTGTEPRLIRRTIGL